MKQYMFNFCTNSLTRKMFVFGLIISIVSGLAMKQESSCELQHLKDVFIKLMTTETNVVGSMRHMSAFIQCKNEETNRRLDDSVSNVSAVIQVKTENTQKRFEESIRNVSAFIQDRNEQTNRRLNESIRDVSAVIQDKTEDTQMRLEESIRNVSAFIQDKHAETNRRLDESIRNVSAVIQYKTEEIHRRLEEFVRNVSAFVQGKNEETNNKLKEIYKNLTFIETNNVETAEELRAVMIHNMTTIDAKNVERTDRLLDTLKERSILIANNTAEITRLDEIVFNMSTAFEIKLEGTANKLDKMVQNLTVLAAKLDSILAKTDESWSSWSNWSECSSTCNGGLKKRTRVCSKSEPIGFGHGCVGNNEEVTICNDFVCPDCACDDNLMCIKQRCFPGTMCPTNKCKNGGTCLVHDSHETCYCTDRYYGEYCSEKTNSSFASLHLKQTPQNRVIRRGLPVFEKCVLDGVHTYEKYTWFLNGKWIQPYETSRGFGTYAGVLLKIDRFGKEHEGLYTCLAETENGVLEHTFEYKMVYTCNFSFEYVNRNVDRNVGENVILVCQVRNAKISWFKDDREIESGFRYKKIGVYQYLSIADLQKADSGTYLCKAEDAAGCQDYREVNLRITLKRKHEKYCGKSVHDEARMVSFLVSRRQNAYPKEVPWHVIFKSDTETDKRAFCGGTLISNRFVLTAAHCVKEFEKNKRIEWDADNVLMLLGTTECTGGRETGTRYRRPKQYILHPEYNKTSQYDSDIALVELNESVSYDEFIRPICLEDAEYNDEMFLEETNSPVMTRGKVSGCGTTSKYSVLSQTLQVVEIPYVTHSECSNALERTEVKAEVTPNMFCAGFKRTRKGDTCKGQNGGGLTMWDDVSERWIQTGIMSWVASGCDMDNMLGVYTNVGVFYDWIERVSRFSEEEESDLST